MSEILERLKGALAGHYAVDREIGHGGMATVFLARDLKHDRDVAIKVLREDLSASLGRERFLAEIRVTAKLAHPNILPLLDSGEADGLLYFVMPYVEGDTLRVRLKTELLLPIDQAVSIAADVADALGYAHEQGVVHRDIKPENILFSGGKAVVADFGIAHALSAAGAERLTAAGLAVGTPSYMSPEQAAGGTVDGRSDEYSLACMVYEMLAGEPPYTGPTPQAVIRKHVTDPVPAVRRLRDTVPESLDEAITQALAKAPVDRYSHISQFGRALREPFLSSSELRMAPALPRRIGWVVAVVVAALAVAFGIWQTRGTSAPATGTALTRVMVLPFSVRGGQEVAYLGDGMVDLLSTKLDGAGNWRSADPRAVLGIVDRRGANRLDPSGGGEIAGQLGADLYVLGNIMEIGGSVHIDASLYRRGNDEAMIQASVEGSSEEVLALVDDLATQLLEGQIGHDGTRLTRLALVTTDSLAALKSYLNGVREFRAARFPEAWDAFQEAVAADTAFALAWYQLSVTADWLLRTDLSPWDASERAMRFSSRLSDRDVQLLMAAHTSRLGDAERAERLYRSVLGSYPDDVEAWLQLGELLFHVKPMRGGDIRESAEAWDRVLEFEPDQPIAFVHQARLAGVTRDQEALDSLTRRVIQLIPEGDRTLEMELLLGLSQPDPAIRQRALDLLRGGSEDALSEAGWSVAAFLQDQDAIASALRLMTESNRSIEMRTLGYSLLAYQELSLGRRIASLALLDSARLFNPVAALEHRANILQMPFAPPDSLTLEFLREELRALDASTAPESPAPGVWVSVHNGIHHQIRSYLLGLVDANLGRNVEAFHEAGELMAAQTPATVGSAFSDWALSIRASAAITERRATDALDLLEDMLLQGWYSPMTASPLLDRSRERWLLATMLEEAGRTDEALRWFGSFEDISMFAKVYVAPSHWRRAMIYEERGELGRAREHYERFVELWDDVDLEFRPMVDTAREWVEGFVEER